MAKEQKIYVTNPSKGKGSMLLGVVCIVFGLLLTASGTEFGWLLLIVGVLLALLGNLSNWFHN